MIAPARRAAYDILAAVSAGSADLATAAAGARSRLRDDRDRALATEIATGVQRWRASLDHVIAASAKRPIERLDPEILEILRLGAYQLLHLTRVPASAVVDDAVDLARRASKSSAAGFVNAVLRSLSRHRGHLVFPPRPADPADRAAALEYFSITLSHPRWLAARWYDRFGFDVTEQWLRFNNTPAPVTLRVNPARVASGALAERLAKDGVKVHKGDWVADALVVDDGSAVRAVELGLCGVQDEASQLVGVLAMGAAGVNTLDACAAPGGKTVMLAAALEGRGRVIACDVRARRIDLLHRTIQASGATNVRLVQADVLRALPFRPVFDLVLVDAPCSGLGTLGRDPDIRWRRHEQDLVSFAAAELTMLQQAAEVVAPRGCVIYATCSSEPEENEAVADAFLATTTRFAPVQAREVSPSIPDAVIDARGHLRTQPDRHGLDAFFAAAFQLQ